MLKKMFKKVSILLIAAAFVYSCQLPFANNHSNKVALNVSALGKGLLSVSNTTDKISEIVISVTDSAGALVSSVTIDPAVTTSQTLDLERGKTFFITIDLSILGMAPSNITRVWKHTEQVTVPTEGSLELPVDLSFITLNTSGLSILSAGSTALTATLSKTLPTDTTIVEWSSSDANVVQVDQSGNLTVLQNGNAIIYAIPSDNGLGAQCNITVSIGATTTTTSTTTTTTTTSTTTTTTIPGIAFWNDTWVANAPTGGDGGYTPTQSATPNAGTKQLTLQYDNGGNASGGGVPTQTWIFNATSANTGTISFSYTFNGFHAYAGPSVSLTAWTNATGSQVNTTLIPNGGPNGAPFSYSSTFTLNVVAGQPYGFTVTGSNGDSTSILNGTIVLTQGPPP